MKKILLSLAVIISAATQAQTLIETNSVPAPWNPAYTIYQCDSLGILPGAAGAAQSWNFATIVTHSLISKTYVSSTNSNPSYPLAYTHVSASASDDSYYECTGGILKYYGGNLLVNSITATLVYSSPAIMAKYPMSLATATSAAVNGSITLNGSLSGTFVGNNAINADATGTLVLSGKTFTDIVRVVSTQTLNATLALGTGVVTQKNYDYYSAAASKAPVFSISTSTIQSTLGGTSTQTLVTILKDYAMVGINENQKSTNEFSVFPNPSSSILNISSANLEAAKVVAYDLTGKMVATELFELGKSKIYVNGLTNGMYLYSVIGKNNQTLSTGKFTVSK